MDPTSIPDPRSARTPQEFVQRMTELRRWAGNPSLRMLRRLAGTTTTAAGQTVDALPESTTSYLLNGRSLPRAPRLEFVEAFVGACLAARRHPREAVALETERWRESWRSLTSRADSEPPPVTRWAEPPKPPKPSASETPASEAFDRATAKLADAPASEASDRATAKLAEAPAPEASGPATAKLADAPASEASGPATPKLAEAPASEVHGPEAPAANRRPHRRLLVMAGAALLVLAVAVAAALPIRAGERTHALSGTLGQASEVHRGTIPAMRDTDGIDFDRGLFTVQGARGVDITPWGLGNHLVTKSGATMVMLSRHGAESYDRCAAVPADQLVVTVRGLYAVAAPRNMCVWTKEGRVAMLTLDETPSPRKGTLAMHYVVWQVKA